MSKQVIDLDSFHHYRVRRVLHGLEIVEYPSDACPSMGDEVDLDSGKPIAVLKDGEEAEFVLGRFTAAIPQEVFVEDRRAGEIWCGDDFIQCLRGDWRKHEGKVVKVDPPAKCGKCGGSGWDGDQSSGIPCDCEAGDRFLGKK